jgi:hypothetical protein
MAHTDDTYSRLFAERTRTVEDIERSVEQTDFAREFNHPAVHRWERIRNYCWMLCHDVVFLKRRRRE